MSFLRNANTSFLMSISPVNPRQMIMGTALSRSFLVLVGLLSRLPVVSIPETLNLVLGVSDFNNFGYVDARALDILPPRPLAFGGSGSRRFGGSETRIVRLRGVLSSIIRRDLRLRFRRPRCG